MKNSKMINLTLAISLVIISFALADAAPTVLKYQNYTVGDKKGWFYDTTTNTASADYTKWASDKTFNLGDYLIFNTNSNQTVVQTLNKTSYKSCSDDDYTIQYYGGDQKYGEPGTVSVALINTGLNYFFSSASDGEQCRHGLAFGITVNRGLGIPPSLNHPPPPAYVAPPPTDDQSPPAEVTSPVGKDTASAGAITYSLVSSLAVFIGFLFVM